MMKKQQKVKIEGKLTSKQRKRGTREKKIKKKDKMKTKKQKKSNIGPIKQEQDRRKNKEFDNSKSRKSKTQAKQKERKKQKQQQGRKTNEEKRRIGKRERFEKSVSRLLTNILVVKQRRLKNLDGGVISGFHETRESRFLGYLKLWSLKCNGSFATTFSGTFFKPNDMFPNVCFLQYQLATSQSTRWVRATLLF